MVHNFYAGPAILPQEVFKEAAQAVLNFNQSGLSILEISHRSADFDAVMQEAEALVREHFQLNDDYAVLFLSGGASSQFFMSAMNILNDNETASYLDTGSWSSKAIKEAKLFGNIEVVASSKDKNYTYIPKKYSIPANSIYLHLTSNNTIFGTQYQQWPDVDNPLICDMSSDIFSRPIPIEKFGLIYAGAQKNMGPAGTTLVIVRKDLIERAERKIPTMLNYKTHVNKNSMFNTPPAFPIYVSMLTLRWLKKLGGLKAVEQKNKEKADLLYNEIDRNSCFVGTVAREDRSLMNVTFLLKDELHTDDFLKMCKEANCVGIKGHRSVGGFRASLYNAMQKESVAVLVHVMQAFEEKYAS